MTRSVALRPGYRLGGRCPMHSWSRTLAALALALPSLLLCAAAQAQTTLPVISGTIQGQVSGCEDPANNQSIDIAFMCEVHLT